MTFLSNCFKLLDQIFSLDRMITNPACILIMAESERKKSNYEVVFISSFCFVMLCLVYRLVWEQVTLISSSQDISVIYQSDCRYTSSIDYCSLRQAVSVIRTLLIFRYYKSVWHCLVKHKGWMSGTAKRANYIHLKKQGYFSVPTLKKQGNFSGPTV